MFLRKTTVMGLPVMFCLFSVGVIAGQGNTQQEKRVPTDPQKLAIEPEEPSGFLLTARFDKGAYKPVEPITLSLKLKNQRGVNTPYWTWPVFEIFRLSVVAPSGKPASLTEYGKQKLLQPQVSRSTIKYILKPGDEVPASILLNRLYDMSVAGEYKISVESSVPTQNDITKWVAVKSKVYSVIVYA